MNSQVVFQDKNRTKRGLSAQAGFTLIEILIVLGIVALIASLATIANTKQYTREVSSSEVEILTATFQKARSRSMNNIDATTHGVYFGSDEDTYIIFAGANFTDSDPDTHELVNKNPAVTLTSDDEEVVFEQLSGNPIGGEITIELDNFGSTANITINEFGMIE